MFFSPTSQLSDDDRERGLRHLVLEAGFSNACTAVTSGVILTAFAMHLGASNTTIGLLAAITFWVQLLQAPGVLLVEKLRARKRIAILASLISRCALAGMAVLAVAPRAGGGTLALLVVLRHRARLNVLFARVLQLFKRPLRLKLLKLKRQQLLKKALHSHIRRKLRPLIWRHAYKIKSAVKMVKSLVY